MVVRTRARAEREGEREGEQEGEQEGEPPLRPLLPPSAPPLCPPLCPPLPPPHHNHFQLPFCRRLGRCVSLCLFVSFCPSIPLCVCVRERERERCHSPTAHASRKLSHCTMKCGCERKELSHYSDTLPEICRLRGVE